MKLILIFILLVIPSVSIGQTIHLIDPNVKELKDRIKYSRSNEEVIYLYLITNYDTTGHKRDVKHYEYPDFSICSFNQEFTNHIKYQVEECREAGGISVTLTLPKIKKETLTNWIEQIHEVIAIDEVENAWNEEKTKFQPVDKGVGCYYTIKETETMTIIENYCGC